MNRYDIALGKVPPPPPKPLRWRPTVVNGSADYFPGRQVALTKFILEIAKARRICTNCMKPIYTTEPCLRAEVVDQQIHRTKKEGQPNYLSKPQFWSRKIQLCESCIRKGEVQRVIKRFKSRQDPTELISKFQEAFDRVQRMDPHPYGIAQDDRHLYESDPERQYRFAGPHTGHRGGVVHGRRGIRGAQPSRGPSGVTGAGF